MNPEELLLSTALQEVATSDYKHIVSIGDAMITKDDHLIKAYEPHIIDCRNNEQLRV